MVGTSAGLGMDTANMVTLTRLDFEIGTRRGSMVVYLLLAAEYTGSKRCRKLMELLVAMAD